MFQMINYRHHSPSSLNLFTACPSMWVMQYILGIKQPPSAAMVRGSAVERGVAKGLMEPETAVKSCVKAAYYYYDVEMVMSGDPRRDDHRDTIPAMIEQALKELRPYGVPTSTQQYMEKMLDSLRLPVIGYLDFAWEDKGIIVDLKTGDKMPGSIKVGHARQVAFYANSNNMQGRLTYVTPKRCETKLLENIAEHQAALIETAKIVENVLDYSDRPEDFLKLFAPDLDSFYWTSPAARQLAFDHWRI
jgi:hypothetical protein